MTCPECTRDFPTEMIQALVSNGGSRAMCPICALRERNTLLGIPLDTPFHGPVARKLYEAALAHVAAMERPWKMEEP